MDNVQGEAPSPAPSDYVSEGSFDELGLSEGLRRAIAERGYTKPTPVQSATYRPVRDGKDVIVRSKTGTGKTAAFGIPDPGADPGRAAQGVGAHHDARPASSPSRSPRR